MYELTPTIYLKFAELLLAEIGTRDFYSGSLTLCDGDVECRRITTLVVERDRYAPGHIVAILPVWWDFKTTLDTEVITNDFSFSEMLETVEL